MPSYFTRRSIAADGGVERELVAAGDGDGLLVGVDHACGRVGGSE